MFKPLIDSNEKQTEDINKNLKSLEENMKKTNVMLPISDKTSSDSSLPIESLSPNLTKRADNSWFKENEEGLYYMAGDRNKNPIFKIEDGKILFSSNDGDTIVNNTPGLEALLFNLESSQKFNKEVVR